MERFLGLNDAYLLPTLVSRSFFLRHVHIDSPPSSLVHTLFQRLQSRLLVLDLPESVALAAPVREKE